MKKRFVEKLMRTCTAIAVCSSMITNTVAAPLCPYIDFSGNAEGDSGYQASFIKNVNDLVTPDYKDYIDSSVMFRLPDGVDNEQDISVIVNVDVINLMDAYDKTEKKMSFSEFALESEEAADIREQLYDKKQQLLHALDEAEIKYSLGEDYSVLLSGFELEIKAGDFAATCKSLGDDVDVYVSEVYHAAQTELVENEVNVYGTGIFDSSESGYDGSGVVVAVLDTGVDSNHTAFSVDNFTSSKLGLTYEDVAALVEKTVAYEQMDGLTVDDVYISDKVPFGFDYADNDPDVYSTHNSHGTHVSGVILGKDDTITGVAPNAQLVSMKIFSDVEDTAKASWILAALEDCVILGVDVINMSLGTSCGFSRETDEEALSGVYDKIREAGISMVVAASNSYSSAFGSTANGNLGLTSNPDTGTVGSPSTYEGVMSVASISGVETPYIKYEDTIIYFNESTDGASEENHFFETLLGEEESIEIEYVLIPGVGRSADYTGIDVEGKIALVRRGSNTFEEKAIIAQQQGAAGIIIYNNVSGDIKMNVGDATLATCSISQDDGEMLAAKESGKLVISSSQTSGPFISDFSSWGPTPDLKIKPEITAHGGSILSAVAGGSYERLSGTSMACPNFAGVTALLRQYVKENFPEIADDDVKVDAMVYCLSMSTADIAFNKNGQPYSVRKQGAGLANLLNAIKTTAYVTTYDQDGKVMDKTKLELGDDPEKTGIYELHFTINNFGDQSLTYDVGAYVMTEGVSETKTNSGKTTVTEESYILDGALVEITAVKGGEQSGSKVTVAAGGNAEVTMTITLGDKDKEYLNTSFENGMYVEGFVTLKAEAEGAVDLSVPYLAFFGDWTKAPLFDKDIFETNADELDDAIADEDKNMADAYSTRPVGGVTDDYVSYLGSYYFLQDPDDMVISASRDYIALSNQEGTIHSLRFVWAGMLRNAKKIEIQITDDTTGEVVFECEDADVRKSYGDGGDIRPSNIEIEFDTLDYNFANNSQYTVTLTGYLDYGDGGLDTNDKNVFEFPLVIDFEAPTVTGVEFYYEYDETLKKNRLYAKAAIYDNHYSMSAQLGYVTEGTDENDNVVPELKTFEQYMTPIYSEKNSTTYVTFELTDYLNDIKNYATTRNTFVLTCYDYALNYATYEIGLPVNFTDFILDDVETEIVISPNEVYTLNPLVYPSTEWGELLLYSSSKPKVARVVNNKIVGVSSGKAVVKIQDPTTNKSITVNVTVLGEEDEGYRRYDKPVADVFRLNGYDTLKAYYIINNDEKEIGDTGSVNFFEGDYELTLYPSESVLLNYSLDAYFPDDTTVEFESSNEGIVKIDAYGTVTAVAEGFASVTIKVMQDGRSTYYSETVSVEVKDPYITTGASLTHYYGNGGLVDIPARLSLTEIGSFAFSNFEYVLKSEEELAKDDTEISKQWYIGDNTITKVIIPEGVKKINSYAFANLTALEEIVLPSTLESIEYGAFYGCSSLEKITFSKENNLKIINQNAFEGCNLKGTLELPAACVISDYAFAGNQNLEGIHLSDKLLSIGQYAFAGCKKLSDVTIEAKKVKYGAYAFTGCETLTDFYVNSSVLPEGMFYECDSMVSVTVGPDVNDIGEFAFRDTAIADFVISDGNKTYKVQTADFILSADGTELVAVSPVITGTFTSDNIGGTEVTSLAKGAFSHNTEISSIVLPKVTSIGKNGLASNESLESVDFGVLESIGEYAFYETAIKELPEFSEDPEIGKYAFACSKLTSVSIPDNMVIAEGTFSDCEELESIVIGNGVTIGKYAFSMNKDKSFNVLNYNEEGKKYFYYGFFSPLTSLTIGDDAVIEENAFDNASNLESITLGKNAVIGKMAFYNNTSLKEIDLSQAKSIGEYAFSGDVYYICQDDSMSVAAVSKEGTYMYTYHAPSLEEIDVSSAESIGEHAFSYCRELRKAVLNSAVTDIPEYAFAGCAVLEDIDLSGVVTVKDYAFMETGLISINLSAAESIGKYAFVSCKSLTEVTLNPAGTDIDEGVFTECSTLEKVINLEYSETIGDYAFTYTNLQEADLSGAVSIGTQAFLKKELSPFKVTLGEKLRELGDNPFAMCDLEPFHIVEVEEFAGNEYTSEVYTYEISPSVFVIQGSLYCQIETGLELITYAGIDDTNVVVADDTVRITSMAFAGSKAQIVTLPYTVKAVGHKAFYGCDSLNVISFGSYEAPIMEEEFDTSYYESFEHIPGTGNYDSYIDYEGNEVEIVGMGLIPYLMWNVTDFMYSNVFYGANFVDYVGYVENKLIMVRPVNGQHYDSYILSQYFDIVLDGAAAPDDITLEAIAAIKAIPDKVTYEDRGLVEAAREAYNKIATTQQQALVTNYADLVSAEQRIIALTPSDETDDGENESENGKGKLFAAIGAVCTVIFIIAAALAGGIYIKNKAKKNRKDKKKNKKDKGEEPEEITGEGETSENVSENGSEKEELPETQQDAEGEEAKEEKADEQDS